eukprot:2420511-Pyramimonas_sp.AAC.1
MWWVSFVASLDFLYAWPQIVPDYSRCFVCAPHMRVLDVASLAAPPTPSSWSPSKSTTTGFGPGLAGSAGLDGTGPP